MPRVGDQSPRRNNRFTAWVGRTVLRLSGWRFEGDVPNCPKLVLIVAPHTSNWDFWHAAMVMLDLDLRVGFIGKHTLFRWPLGVLMRWLGGTPVRRDTSAGRVQQIVDTIHAHERYILALAPEGTRKRTERWKTGFYRVAHAAGVPIAPGYIDYARRVVGIGPLLHPSGDIEADLGLLQRFYADKQPRYPAQF